MIITGEIQGGFFENYGGLFTLLWGIFKIHSCIPQSYLCLQNVFYDGSNSSSFTLDAVSLF